jgi:intein/homing endonuclease
MRLQFQPGKQREVIYTYREKHSHTWKTMCSELDVKPGALHMWRLEQVLLPSTIYERLDPERTFEQYIVKELDNNWGRSKGGRNSHDTTTTIINEPLYCAELAEFIGVLLGDGNSYWSQRHHIWQIRITGHRDEEEYFKQYLVPLCERLFHITPKVYFHKKTKAIILAINSKNLSKYLEKIGFPPGNKVERQACGPTWVFSNKEYMKAYLRGLIDTDGSIYLAGKWAQLSFKNSSVPLLEDHQKVSRELGLYASKITSKQVYISRQSHISKYYKEVGFHNLKNARRYERFMQPRRLAAKRSGRK